MLAFSRMTASEPKKFLTFFEKEKKKKKKKDNNKKSDMRQTILFCAGKTIYGVVSS